MRRLGKNSTAPAIRRAFSALRCARPLWPLRSGAQKHPPGGAKRRLWLGAANFCPAALAAALVLLPCLAFAAPPDGQQIVLHGNDNGAMPCAACHGADGAGNTSIGAPALAGLPATEIETYLKQFAAGDGGNMTMHYIAQALSPAETVAVANYFAGLKKP